MILSKTKLALFTAVFVVFAALPQTPESSESKQENAMKITIQARDTQEPISKYIYGQFIEHLGRCIYGGIWAEMLEDRKFYFPITDEFHPWKTETDDGYFKGGDFQTLAGSPWKVIGGAGTVRMTTDDSFVGEHSPEVVLKGNTACGIEQGELALEKGKDYEGRVILSGGENAGPIQVMLIWGDGDGDRATFTVENPDRTYRTYPFRLKAGENTENGRIRIVGMGEGIFRIGTVSLMPADNVDGLRSDTLALLKELDSPVYRWPGGNFVSGYDWRDGVGDRDQRPPRTNPAWTGIESNDFGLHEFIDFCKKLDTEPYIAVNTGLGKPEEAAAEVEYCNGAVDTPMGKIRAKNGHPEPFHVKWWAVGNEMYGSWQLGHMPLEEYVKKHNRCAEAMRAVDPSIQLVAVGSAGDWSRAMMTHCADHMDLISEHIYQKEKDDLVEHVGQLAARIKEVAEVHRRYRKEIEGLGSKDIRIAMDEWNYWYGRYIYGELGVRYYLQDALGVAKALHEYFRNSDLYFMANYAQTVNVIGAIKTSKTDACFATTGLALKLYRERYGDIPVQVEGVVDPLDITAAWIADRKAMTVGIVNPTLEEAALDLQVQGVEFADRGSVWFIRGTDRRAFNEPGKSPRVAIEEKENIPYNDGLVVPPLSVSVYRFEVR